MRNKYFPFQMIILLMMDAALLTGAHSTICVATLVTEVVFVQFFIRDGLNMAGKDDLT